MKTPISLILLLLTLSTTAQDTIKSVKSTNTSTHTVTGYVVQLITKTDTTYRRVDKFSELPPEIQVNRKSPIKNYPKNLLKNGEVYMNHKRSNRF
jgi:uncharacterized protein YoxC